MAAIAIEDHQAEWTMEVKDLKESVRATIVEKKITWRRIAKIIKVEAQAANSKELEEVEVVEAWTPLEDR